MIERYRKIIRMRCVAAVVYAVLGSLLLAVLFLGGGSAVPDYMLSFFVGTGAMMVMNGIVNFCRKNRLLKDEQELCKKAVVEFDERNVEVMRRAWALALEVLLVIGWAAMVIAGFFSETVCYTLLASLCVVLLTAFVCYTIVWKTT